MFNLRLIALIVFALASNFSHARTTAKMEYVCPVGGEKFTAEVEASGTSWGQNLDLKPIGPIGAPGLIAQCPGHKLVIYKGIEEFSESDVEKLTKFILSDHYKNLSKNNTTFYLAAKTMEYLDEDQLDVAHVYLKATWQVYEDMQKYIKYATETRKAFLEFLQTHPSENDEWVVANILIGEMLRRLERFGEAKKHFAKLSTHASFSEENIYKKILEYQLELIGKKDSEPHKFQRKN